MSPDVAKTVIEYLESFDDVDLKIKAINELKSLIHQHSRSAASRWTACCGLKLKRLRRMTTILT